jgi:lipoprotein-releasing system permease protein
MRYEAMIGLRYLKHRPPARKLLLGLMLTFVGVAVLSALFWVLSSRPPPVTVFTFTIGAIGAIVTGVVSFFSVFTSVSIFGVVLGVSALTIVMSVTSGFQKAFKDKVLGVNAHVLVMRNTLDFGNYRDVEKTAAAEPGVVAVQPFVFVEMLITRGKGELSGIALKGVDPDRIGTVLDLPRNMIDGSVRVLAAPRLEGAPPPIIIGKELAEKLKAKVDDVVTLVLPVSTPGAGGWQAGRSNAKMRKFRVAGIFYSGFDEYDRRLVYVGIAEAQDFVGEGDVVTGVEMKLADVDRASEVARRLEEKLGGDPYMVVDWRSLNNNLFTALTIQKVALLVFLTLIIIVAAFNMVAALTMMVLDKVKEIAILKSMGANAVGVSGIFQVVGMTIGGLGTLLGLLLGLALCHVVARYGYELDPKVYLIDKLPIQVDPFEVALVAAMTLAICFVATLYPALKASALHPVEGLRYE